MRKLCTEHEATGARAPDQCIPSWAVVSMQAEVGRERLRTAAGILIL